jgi:hypothetical protein
MSSVQNKRSTSAVLPIKSSGGSVSFTTLQNVTLGKSLTTEARCDMLRKKTIQSLMLPASLVLALSCTVCNATTWDFGATPDKNWSSFTNWDTDASPAATDVIFGTAGVTANATTVSNIVDTSYTGVNALTSLTYNANSTNWQVTQISSPQTLTVAGAFLVGGLTTNSQNTRVAFTGTGSLVINNGASTIVISNTGGTSTKSTLDMSALSTFTATASSFNVGTGATGFGTVYLADSSTITATSINSGGSGASYGSAVSNLLYLGTTTVLNSDTVALAGNRTFGTVKFRAVGDGAANNTAVSGATLKIRGSAGGTDDNSRAAMTVGAWTGTFPGTGTSSVNLTGGTVDAKVTTLKVGTTSANGAAATASAFLTIDGSASIFDASGLITVGETTAGTSGTLNGTLNVKGGATFTADSITLGRQTTGAIATNGTLSVADANTSVSVTNNITMGTRSGTAAVTATVGVSGGTLTVGGNMAEGAGAASITSAVNLSGGTINMTRGNVSVDTFAFTGGTLKNTASFTAATTGGLHLQDGATTKTLAFDLVDGVDPFSMSLALTGDLTIGTNSNLGIVLANGVTLTDGAVYSLVANDQGDPIVGTFATVNGGAFGTSNSFSLTNNTGTYLVQLLYDGEGANAFGGNDLVILVPEPSASVLLSVAGVALLARRRRLK